MRPLLVGDFKEINSLQENENSKRKYILGVKYAIYSMVIFGFISFQIKLIRNLYKENFNSNTLILLRSISSVIPAYVRVIKNSSTIKSFSEINSKFWLMIRILFNYLNMTALALCIIDLRASTASCMGSMSPVIMIILSVIILKEKFYMRYLIGVVICTLGSTLIVLNERKPIDYSHEDISENIELKFLEYSPNTIRGIFWGIFHILFSAFTNVAQKKLAIENIPIETQVIYMGGVNFLMSLFVSLFVGLNLVDLRYVMLCFLHGILFYTSFLYHNESLKNITLSQFTPLLYLGTLTVFVCSVIFLEEVIYLSDVIGSLIILSFNIYNSWYPVDALK